MSFCHYFLLTSVFPGWPGSAQSRPDSNQFTIHSWQTYYERIVQPTIRFHEKHLDLRQKQEHTSAKTNVVQIWSPYPESKSNVIFLVQGYIRHKIFTKIRSVYPEIWAKLRINALSRNVGRMLWKFLDSDPEADDFQNLISSSLSTDTRVVKFSRRSVQQFLCRVANRQTERQTPGIILLPLQR